MTAATPLTGQALTNQQNMASVSNNLQQLQQAIANALTAVQGDPSARDALMALSQALASDITENVIGISEGYTGASNTNGS